MIYSKTFDSLPMFVRDYVEQIEFGSWPEASKEKKPRSSVKNVWDKNVKPEENLYFWRRNPIIINKKQNLPKGSLTIVELFSGCGGISTGFEMAGYTVRLGLDIHTPSAETYIKNHPDSSFILGDIKQVDTEDVKRLLGGRGVDVLIGGVPCQGFSLNNRKRNKDDERNFLYKEFLRFLGALKPKAVVLENVAGMRSLANGLFHKAIERDLGAVGGMNVVSQILNAADYGVPQKRNRLVFVGVRGKKFEFDSVIKTHGPELGKPYVTIKEAIGDLPSLKAGESAVRYRKSASNGYQRLMRAGAPSVLQNHEAPNHPAETIQKIADTEPGRPMYANFKQRIRLSWDMQSPTQVSGGIRPQFQFGHPEDDRGLTIRERARIQSFPDRYVISGGIVQGRVQTGNAVPPLLAYAIAKALKEYLK